jgi:hypothetical protein
VSVHEQLREAVAVRRHGQSAYAPEGQRSWTQREHDAREALDLLTRVAFGAGRAAGIEEGRRRGRLEVWRRLGAAVLVDVIRHDLERIREELEASGVDCLSERTP